MNKYYPEISFRTACIWRFFRKYRDKSFFGITKASFARASQNPFLWFLRRSGLLDGDSAPHTLGLAYSYEYAFLDSVKTYAE